LLFDFARVDVGKSRSVYDIVRGSALHGGLDLGLFGDIHLQAAAERVTVIRSDSDRAAL
jgi:hypothetical protein